MKKHLNLRLIFALCLLAPSLFAAIRPVATTAGSHSVAMPDSTEADYVTLRKGTVVTLRLEETLNSEEAEQGNTVALVVYGDVIVDGMTLVATGRDAEGEVAKKRKPGVFGKGATLVVNASSLKTVDGQHIPLRSKGLKRTGGDRTFFACGVSTVIPIVGMALANPWFVPFAVTGLLIKGKEVEIQKGTTFTAYVAEDVRIMVR